MASTKDKVQTALSEVRTLVLGAQILLGFQYQAVFRPRFEELPGYTKAFESVAFALMMVTVGCLIAPSSFHRISEGGEATRRQLAYTKGMITSALVPFVLAIGATLFIATATYLGTTSALVLGLSTAAVAAFFLFGVERMQRSKRRLHIPGKQGDEGVPLREKSHHFSRRRASCSPVCKHCSAFSSPPISPTPLVSSPPLRRRCTRDVFSFWHSR